MSESIGSRRLRVVPPQPLAFSSEASGRWREGGNTKTVEQHMGVGREGKGQKIFEQMGGWEVGDWSTDEAKTQHQAISGEVYAAVGAHR